MVFLAIFLALAFGKLFVVSPKICITATTVVTLPVLAFLRAFSSALLLIETGSMTLIRQGCVDYKSDKNGSSNLRRLSTTNSMSRPPISNYKLESILDKS